jgi:hypothetical protein
MSPTIDRTRVSSGQRTDAPTSKREFVTATTTPSRSSTSATSVTAVNSPSVFATYDASVGLPTTSINVRIDSKRSAQQADNLRANRGSKVRVDTSRSG